MTPLAFALLAVAAAAPIAAHLITRYRRPPQCRIELTTPQGIYLSSQVNAPQDAPATNATLPVIIASKTPTEIDITVTGHDADGNTLTVLADATAHTLAALGDHHQVRQALSAPWPASQPFPQEVRR